MAAVPPKDRLPGRSLIFYYFFFFILLLSSPTWLEQPAVARAEFTNSFHRLLPGQTVTVRWTPFDGELYPLSVLGRAYNETGDGEVNAFEVNVAANLTIDSFQWTGIPSPLPYIPGARYELQVRRRPTEGSNETNSDEDEYEDGGDESDDEREDDDGESPSLVILRSGLFSIGRNDDGSDDNGPRTGFPVWVPYPKDNDSSSSDGSSSSENVTMTVAVALGIGIPIIVGCCVLGWWLTRRRARVREREKRERRSGLDIN